MLWWERVAPFGNPVVPEVYWMLIGSSQDSSGYTASRPARPARPANSPQLGSPMYTTSRNPRHLPRTSSTIAR
jgi:hypothetical protein